MTQRPVRALIVDDSASIRGILASILRADGIEIAGEAANPYEARQLIKELKPDVLTLDIEMPRMDGLSFLEKLMTLHPMPVVMVSTLTRKGADATLHALELGAVDFVAKPGAASPAAFSALTTELPLKVRAAAASRPSRKPSLPRTGVIPQRPCRAGGIIAIGASTGGVEALRQILTALPPEMPPIAITQHMPPLFTASFAERLDKLCALRICEARDGETLKPGHAVIAPGGRHLHIRAAGGGRYVAELTDGGSVSGHKPSVDVLFASAAEAAGDQALGVILTGMGRDGADGLLHMRRRGAHTIGQDEASCVVYGMPKAAMQAGGVAEEIPLSHIAGRMAECTAIPAAPTRLPC